MKIFAVILVLIIIIGGTIVLLFTTVAGGPYLNFTQIRQFVESTFGRLSLGRNNGSFAYSTVFEEVKSLSRLQVIEYVYKLVFPYDFLGEDEDVALELAVEAGLRRALDNDVYNFIVLTAYMEIGYDLETLDFDEIVTIYEDGSVSLSLPPAELLHIRIADIDNDYPYPDPRVAQEHWGKIAAFIEERLPARPETREAIKAAEDFLATFFSTFFDDVRDVRVQ